MAVPPFTSSAPKMEIVALLAARNGFTRYLELCTSSTGLAYAALDRSVLTTAHRLMYNCPADFHDGQAIDFRAEGFDIGPCLAQIDGAGLRYDIMLVDPWHEYDTSLRDLRAAFDLIEGGGMLVVHDCLPPDAATAAPKHRVGDWCGVTYKAYLDFVCGRPDLDYRTVDIDYGCGLIRKRRSDDDERIATGRSLDGALWKQWHELGNDFDRTFAFLQQYKKELLNLINPADFLAAP